MLKFKFNDLFLLNRLALNVSQIWIHALGVIVAYVCYYLFTAGSLLLAGVGISKILSFGIFPSPYNLTFSLNLASQLMFLIACFSAGSVLMISSTASCRASFMTLKGKSFFSWRAAYKFGLSKSKSVLSTPFFVGVGITSIAAGIWLVGLIGRIPYLGELAVSIFSVLWILMAFGLLFLLIVGAASLVLAPTVIAVTNEDAFESIFQSFATVVRQLPRFLFYEGVVVLMSVVGFFTSAVLVKRSILFMNTLLAFSMGEKYVVLASQAQYRLQSWVAGLDPLILSIFGKWSSYFYFNQDFAQASLTTTMQISTFLMAVSMLFFGVLVLAYLLACFNVGNTIAYLQVRRIAEGENLIEDERLNHTPGKPKFAGDDVLAVSDNNSGRGVLAEAVSDKERMIF